MKPVLQHRSSRYLVRRVPDPTPFPPRQVAPNLYRHLVATRSSGPASSVPSTAHPVTGKGEAKEAAGNDGGCSGGAHLPPTGAKAKLQPSSPQVLDRAATTTTSKSGGQTLLVQN